MQGVAFSTPKLGGARLNRKSVAVLLVIASALGGAGCMRTITGAVTGGATGAAIGSAVTDTTLGATVGGAVGAGIGSVVGAVRSRFSRQQEECSFFAKHIRRRCG
jgi:hypothetical protein